jgi:hypothetical protein
MNYETAIELIHENLGGAVVDTLIDGLPSGHTPEWGYDKELVIDIGKALEQWEKRKSK